ncbi:hypothetical protein PWT90_06661 [Aphanocladium album]|nr:hypothetical protein PWT90_06661 [Aphanocladium album]
MGAPGKNLLTRRRNGKLRSSRGKVASCVYHPAPMTRPREKASDPARWAVESAAARQLFSPSRTLEPAAAESTPSSSATPDIVHATGTEFFGATAFCAIIDENRDIVNQDIGSYRNQQMYGGSWNANQVSETRIHAAIEALLLLTNFPATAECIYQYLDLSFTSMVPPHLIKACVASLEEIIIEPSRAQSDEARDVHLRQIVLKLFENTSQPLEFFTSIPAEEYHTLFTGPNIRWEVVGFVLCVLGVALKYDINKRHMSSTRFRNTNNSHLVHQIADAVEFCISVCHRYNCVNHQALWLLHGGACLQSLIHGDMSFHYWRGIGDLSSMFFALGLHQDSARMVGSCPFYQLELRRRYAAQIFSMDKTISTLLGRPPRIPGAHCASTLPADIDNEVLLLEGEELDMALKNIDTNGWNIDRKYRGSTWRRLKLIVSRFREEVLGVCLRPQTDSESDALTRDILERHQDIWNQVPAELKYNELTGFLNIPPAMRYVVMMTYLDQRYSSFMLYRKLTKWHQNPREPLHTASRSLLRTVLQVVALSDQDPAVHRDLSSSILYYGFPGASILAVDLWKGLHGSPDDSAGQTDSIPRAEVLQNLSVFISTLQRIIDRKEAHSPACKWVHGSLSRILSEILDPQLRKPDRTECRSAADALYLSTIGQDVDILNFDNLFSQMDGADWSADVFNVLL